jgi:hypothetical protein
LGFHKTEVSSVFDIVNLQYKEEMMIHQFKITAKIFFLALAFTKITIAMEPDKPRVSSAIPSTSTVRQILAVPVRTFTGLLETRPLYVFPRVGTFAGLTCMLLGAIMYTDNQKKEDIVGSVATAGSLLKNSPLSFLYPTVIDTAINGAQKDIKKQKVYGNYLASLGAGPGRPH